LALFMRGLQLWSFFTYYKLLEQLITCPKFLKYLE